MTFKDLIAKFKTPRKQKTEDEIKKESEERKEISLIKASKLRHLISSNTGWKEVSGLIQDYIDACYLRKLKTPLDTATPETLEELKYMDREIYVLQWVLQIPKQFIEKTEKLEKENE